MWRTVRERAPRRAGQNLANPSGLFLGSVMMLLFALGHCLPIAVAGSSTALVRRLTENSAWQGAGAWFRRGAGIVIGLLGAYFIATPFVAI